MGARSNANIIHIRANRGPADYSGPFFMGERVRGDES